MQHFKRYLPPRGNFPGIRFHSDQGNNYKVYAFRNCLRGDWIHQRSFSMILHDNAIAEAFFSIMKQEDIFLSYGKDQQDLENTVANYIEFYKFMCHYCKQHNLLPEDFERSFYVNNKKQVPNVSYFGPFPI